MTYTILNQCTKDKAARDAFIRQLEETVEFAQHTAKSKYVSFSDDFCEAEQNEIVSYLLRALDDKQEWKVESDDRDQVDAAFIKLLDFNTKDNVEHYAEVSKKAARKYFARQLDDLISDMIEDRSQFAIQEYGMGRMCDPERVNGTNHVR